VRGGKLPRIFTHASGSNPFPSGQQLRQRFGQLLPGLDFDSRYEALAEEVSAFGKPRQNFRALRHFW
jgi:hypothetical protein